ncbi:ATP-binding cassette domain-containing protein [Polynucleobacter sp. MWH-UH19D]|uniref:ATP-binding cassette domain-containing protein n=1 Tax=Polynucleobacter sp. MWH-UH19D TaxID=1855610 RepID=UPI00336523E7
MSSHRLSQIVTASPIFFKYVFKNFPLTYVALIGILLGVILEYAVLSIMIPLSVSGGAQNIRSVKVIELWNEVAYFCSMPNDPATWLWIFLLLFSLRMIIGLLQIILNTIISKKIHAELSASTFAAVISKVPISEIYKRTIGYYMGLAGDDAIRVGQLFFSFVQMLSALLAALVGLAVLYLYSANVFIFTVIFLSICGFILGFLLEKILTLSIESSKFSREASTAFIEAFNGLRSIRSMAAENYVDARYKKAVYRYTKVLFRIEVFNHASRTIPGLVLLVGGLVLIFPGSGLIENVSIVYFFVVTTMLVRVLSFLGVAVYSGGKLAADIRAVLDLKQIIIESEKYKGIETKNSPIETVNKIVLSDLSCGYIAGQPILSGITAQMKPGTVYALIGKSGSGKSTLSDILLGLLQPMAGGLEISGIPFERLDINSIRRRIILVEQQTRIFSASIRENITFGFPSTDSGIRAAVDASGLTEFIDSLPFGIDTELDYQGGNLSGGQRQRIGLARALIRNPDMLILDEATSALDPQTRDAVLKNLMMLYKEKILLFITHDKYLIELVDEIWRIHNGRLEIRSNVTP